MKRRAVAAGVLTALATVAGAEISLSPPVDCSLGDDCYIQQYVDHDPSKRARDFTCSSLSYDTHKGTDFALRNYADLRRGVDVIASASGTVQALRDGQTDRLYGGKWGEVPSNRACGNGVVIAHENGWTTQYCHLKKGSIVVRKGQTVKRGAVLGQIGMSGRSQFPHVHLTLRKDGKVVDPFDPDGKIMCGSPSTETLWARPIPYQPGGLLDVGFADAVPEYAAIKAGQAGRRNLPRDASAIVIYGFAFGGRANDIVDLSIKGPQGELVRESVKLTKNQAQYFRAVGKKRRQQNWPAGRYSGVVRLIRGGQVIDTERTELRIR